jgi:hypothetical protein
MEEEILSKPGSIKITPGPDKKKKVIIILSVVAGILLLGELIQGIFWYQGKQQAAKDKAEQAKYTAWVNCVNDSIKSSKDVQELMPKIDTCHKQTK